ncbi:MULTISPECIES: glycine oxidase ThiO [unclassified Rhodococcus (in: high G+C Gram-positive bacteria)]|uniref:glycine oxidase ThiO n=1 Tax=unclassified Rhodococcus (in: high G+C Gram-positive bacteria) TaxID=192944 RepID=UPI000AEC105D
MTVVGGGVIGLFIARAAATAGWSVTLHDPVFGSRTVGDGAASWVAGGMLAPLSEGWPGEHDLLALGAESLRRWHDLDPGPGVVTSTGSVTVAFDAADAADLRTAADWVRAQGHDLTMLSRSDVRALEPAVSPRVRAGVSAPAEMAVDNRAVVALLEAEILAAGVRVSREPVTDLGAVTTERIVVAAGWAASSLVPGLPVRPVKGEILRLRARRGSAAAPTRTIRASVNGRAVYLVPRGDGLVVGATQYEHGNDTAVTVGGVRDLLADAEAVFPAIGDYELAEAAAGLRPGSPDNIPIIGSVDDRVVVAAGHGRNGVLLAPVTADAVVAELDGAPLAAARCALPQRFPMTVGAQS